MIRCSISKALSTVSVDFCLCFSLSLTQCTIKNKVQVSSNFLVSTCYNGLFLGEVFLTSGVSGLKMLCTVQIVKPAETFILIIRVRVRVKPNEVSEKTLSRFLNPLFTLEQFCSTTILNTLWVLSRVQTKDHRKKRCSRKISMVSSEKNFIKKILFICAVF